MLAQRVGAVVLQPAGEGEGSLPEGFTSPKSTSANARPACEPPNQPCTTAGTRSIQGIATALPDTKTTAVRGLASASASISES